MNKLIVLTGPTAVGKSKLSIELAKSIGGEIISADSMQVYKYMDIGTDKIKPEEMGGVPHHLIDFLEPTEDFNVVLFQKYVKEAMEGIYHRGHIPILVGGTGFYIQAILYDIDFTQTDADMTYRHGLEQIAQVKGPEVLHQRLELVDPESAAAIPAGNVKRVIRALEYYEKTGHKISDHNKEQHEKTSPYDFRYFVLTDHREILYERIEKRVDKMIEEGLENECKKLMTMGIEPQMTSMQGLGYREMIGYLSGEYDLERAIYLIKRNTRHFAKRQLTWFRREKDVIWVDKSEYNRDDAQVLEAILDKI
ncbi:tRNA dimethylallyltransferase [Butyrivibrio fibrisolvens DSM 3071]|uniref:tRNA dimethylallyltransferase n=1 Tax=Butyrivibrio fibrisolvens DSM 3071 TaxID=1121131 RepID=A0A1M5WML8_BUTFI|nr:tRNA (adenosine(37)-N6)-dimethylallyltransferase MiaA [Butyrivibrio fibrisolvens]SHH88728.1 tRNA dimethylallyltransferase [Butyrivibrio fibrisolvens DSM 3071]